MTDAKRDLIHLSLPSEDRFVEEWSTGQTGLPFVPCGSRDVYKAYSRWCRDNGVRNPRESNQFIGRIKRLPGWKVAQEHVFGTRDCHRVDGKKETMVTPDMALLEKSGIRPSESRSKSENWTHFFFDFRDSLESV